MTDYNNEYFFLRRPADEGLPYPQPDEDTAELNYMFEVLPLGSRPLKFFNGMADMQKEQGIRPYKGAPEVMFVGSDLLVSDRVREKLLPLEVPRLALQPAIYVDDDGKWHETFWYLTFIDRFDCWDRDQSDYDRDDPIDIGGTQLFDVYSFKLNEKLLDKTPLQERLLFKMGGVNPAPVTVHKSLAGVFRSAGQGACELQAVADFEG
ncbi:imm11 family protein [Piscinibacter gummiphilus]|uniref:Immunity MXAN-0049 protein domain-containing protein n=1 Tax=Piscinibacter gummiphilus TaxID=946333 RepID=A0ABZ0D7R5_9BURK|nr:hypothetical protein [Piscinibacter gummiphilus]WOB11307.1 hypothetical protein RXV79_27880 [Piscinibacter gummiphilus]